MRVLIVDTCYGAFLDAHLYEPVTIASAAAHLGSGPSQLARAFRAVFGITPHAYVTGRRLDTARAECAVLT